MYVYMYKNTVQLSGRYAYKQRIISNSVDKFFEVFCVRDFFIIGQCFPVLEDKQESRSSIVSVSQLYNLQTKKIILRGCLINPPLTVLEKKQKHILLTRVSDWWCHQTPSENNLLVLQVSCLVGVRVLSKADINTRE